MIVGGFNPVLESIRAHPERIRWVGITGEGQGRMQKIVAETRKAGIPLRQLREDQITQFAPGLVHNGVVAEISKEGYANFDDCLNDALQFVLILDGIQDPQNFGAILRVADGFGAGLVVIPEHGSAGMSAGTIKASAGASEWVKIARVTNLSRAIDQLKEIGFWVYGAAADGEPIGTVDLTGRVALVVGSEEKGIRQNVLGHCDRMVSIPMQGRVSSLNVATATAVIAFEIDRQRRQKSGV